MQGRVIGQYVAASIALAQDYAGDGNAKPATIIFVGVGLGPIPKVSVPGVLLSVERKSANGGHAVGRCEASASPGGQVARLVG
jgi:hypothetical protein